MSGREGGEPRRAASRPGHPQWLRASVRDEEVVLSFGAVEKIMSADAAVNFAWKLINAARHCDLLRGLRLARTYDEVRPAFIGTWPTKETQDDSADTG